MCGAALRDGSRLGTDRGSPPRVRSRRAVRPVHVPILGITSACAEQTPPIRPTWTRTGDHLRVCGADEIIYSKEATHAGSPPRVRSRRRELPVAVQHGGITSACAEQTGVSRVIVARFRDHLRVCGADAPSGVVRPAVDGSPPRVRSRPDLGASPSAWQGIISACAEQTGNPTTGGSPEGDHLRVCGADLISAEAEVDGIGSSPRVRSRHRLVGRACPPPGIISACAEQTAGGWYAYKAVRDHLCFCSIVC